MLKSKKVIDIFPPKKLKEYYDLSVEKDIGKKERPVKVEREKRGRSGKILFFISLFLIGGAIFLHFVLAKINIEIWPETENLNLDEEVTVNINTEQINLAQSIIPGEAFEAERSISQEFNSSGKEIKEKSAGGIIRVYNNYDLPQTLVANTRFQPALENVIYFRSVKTNVIPAKSYLDIEVKADRPGEEYNIEPATFSVPGLAGLPQYYSVYGKSFSQMTGGFKGLVGQVKEEDLDLAEKSLSEKLKKEAKDYFAAESAKDLISAAEDAETDSFIFLDEGFIQEIIEASSSVATGTEADSFSFNLKAKTRAIAFKKSDLDNFVKELIRLKIQDTDKKIEEQSLKIDYSVNKIDLPSGKIILNLKISVKIYADVNQGSVKKALFGKSLKESQLLLESQPFIIKAKLNVFPPWLRRIPENEEKIKIKLNID